MNAASLAVIFVPYGNQVRLQYDYVSSFNPLPVPFSFYETKKIHTLQKVSQTIKGLTFKHHKLEEMFLSCFNGVHGSDATLVSL